VSIVQVRTKVADKEVEALVGTIPKPEHFPFVLRGSGAVWKANGDLLCMVLPKAISQELKAAALPFMRLASNVTTTNRGLYAGGERTRKVLKDGTLSNTLNAPPVRSSVAGYMDRYARIPYCRTTFLTADHDEKWGASLPMIQHVASLFQKHSPKRYAAQLEVAHKTHPSYVIKNTPFTTLTINGSVAGAYHRDKGDFAGGLGVISVFREGNYDGCYLGFPAYGVAADLQDGDVILFDPHEVHGNTPFVAEGEAHKDYERISIVYYFREKMLNCLAPELELERVKDLRGSLPQDDDATEANAE
jgi:hypothetical protein